MHSARASNIPLRSIRWDGSLPERMAGLALLGAVENGKDRTGQPGNGRSGHSPPRR